MAWPIVAVDVGNSRVKLGLFREFPPNGFPEPELTVAFDSSAPIDASMIALPDVDVATANWWIASVNRPAAKRLQDWLGQMSPGAQVRQMDHTLMPACVEVEHPQRVGLDRLAGAVAANRLRRPNQPAITVHVGSAITVNWISAAGVLEGGAILPGIGMSARALHEFTDQLPLLDVQNLDDIDLAHSEERHAPPVALGKSTTAAMQSGLYWGAIGAIRELIARLDEQSSSRASVFLTGGAAPLVGELLQDRLTPVDVDGVNKLPRVTHVPNLVLSGIAIAAASQTRSL